MKRCITAVLFPLVLLATGWPVGDDMAEPKPVGNSWGGLQSYGDDPYLHPGVDVMSETIGQPIRAVAPGIVKAWLTFGHDIYWRLAIADEDTDDSCDAWLYAHVDPDREHKLLGDWVQEGDIIGYVVPWPVMGFDHLHWARIRSAGQVWQADWIFVDNPAVELDPPGDTLASILEKTRGEYLFAFRPNDTTPNASYFSPDSIYGEVDIVAKIVDKTGEGWKTLAGRYSVGTPFALGSVV